MSDILQISRMIKRKLRFYLNELYWAKYVLSRQRFRNTSITLKFII